MCHEHRSVCGVIEPPLVRAAVSVDFKFLSDRVEAPHSRFDEGSLVFRCARFADVGVIKHAVAAVEPAIVAPHEAVGCFMCVLEIPTV